MAVALRWTEDMNREDAERTPPRVDLSASPLFRCFGLIAVLVYVDWFNVLSVSTLDLQSQLKYVYFAVVASAYAYTLLTTRRLRFGLDGPTILALFSICSITALVLQAAGPEKNDSYAAAFLATLVISTAGLYNINKYGFSRAKLIDVTARTVLLMSMLYVAELAFRMFSELEYFQTVENMENHIKSFILVAGVCLAVLRRSQRGLLIGLALLALSQALRPSSTSLFTLACVLPIAVLIARGRLRMAKLAVYTSLLVAPIVPVALHLSPDLKEIVTSAEAWAKEDVLSGTSNTFFRLAIQDLAIDRLQETSLAFGVMFSESNSVQLSNQFAWWLEKFREGRAAIHSDYVSILLQSGIVGYVLFTVALLSLCRYMFKGLAMRSADETARCLPAFSICCIVLIVIYCSTNPFLQYWGVSHVAWLGVAIGYLDVTWSLRRRAIRA